MEVSTDFEHLVYREAELDAIWSITGFFLANEPRSIERDTVRTTPCRRAPGARFGGGEPAGCGGGGFAGVSVI